VEKAAMLTKCANPDCREEFLSLRRGRLFTAEPKGSRDGHFDSND